MLTRTNRVTQRATLVAVLPRKPKTAEEYKVWFAILGGKARRDELTLIDRSLSASRAA